MTTTKQLDALIRWIDEECHKDGPIPDEFQLVIGRALNELRRWRVPHAAIRDWAVAKKRELEEKNG